jgi:hypothetical protein
LTALDFLRSGSRDPITNTGHCTDRMAEAPAIGCADDAPDLPLLADLYLARVVAMN